MTYVVRIWEPPSDRPLPDSLDGADKLLHELDACRPSGENPKFVALAQRLTQRFPTPDDWPAEPGAEEEEIPLAEIAWNGWPILGEDEEAVWNLGLNTAMLGEVRPFVMREAAALGLCVTDIQVGEVHLPDGRVLCPPGSSPVSTEEEGGPESLPRTREVLALVYERLTPLITARGYKCNKRRFLFRREFPEGLHELRVQSPADWWPAGVEFELFATARFHAISDLEMAIAYPDMSPEDVAIQRTLLGPQKNWIEGGSPFLSILNRGYEVRNRAEIAPALGHLVAQLNARLLPALDGCRTVEDFDRALNPPPGAGSCFNGTLGGETNIMAAYLARNPRLQEICEKYDPRPRYAEGWRPAPPVERCIDYVRSHPLD